MKNPYAIQVCHLIALIIGSSIGVFAFLWSIGLMRDVYTLGNLTSSLPLIDPAAKVNVKDAAAIIALAKKGLIISGDNLVSTLISNYSMVIASLIGIIALLGFAGFFIVRASYHNQIEFALKEHMGGDGFKAQQRFVILGEIPMLFETFETEKLAHLDSLEERLDELERKLTDDTPAPTLRNIQRGTGSGGFITSPQSGVPGGVAPGLPSSAGPQLPSATPIDDLHETDGSILDENSANNNDSMDEHPSDPAPENEASEDSLETDTELNNDDTRRS